VPQLWFAKHEWQPSGGLPHNAGTEVSSQTTPHDLPARGMTTDAHYPHDSAGRTSRETGRRMPEVRWKCVCARVDRWRRRHDVGDKLATTGAGARRQHTHECGRCGWPRGAELTGRDSGAVAAREMGGAGGVRPGGRIWGRGRGLRETTTRPDWR